MSILAGILTIVLVLISLFLILVVLMQRGNAGGGLGAAMGGGMAESAFGAETSSVLTRLTTKVSIVFFVMVLGLYLVNLYIYRGAREDAEGALPQFDEAPASSPLSEILSEPATPVENASQSLEDAANQIETEAGVPAAEGVTNVQEAAQLEATDASDANKATDDTPSVNSEEPSATEPQ